MGILLGHGSVDWIVAGFVVFAGLMIFMIKVARGHIGSVAISAAVWFFVYSIHKGTNTGIMTATLAALLFDMIGIPIIKLFMRR